MPIDQHSPTRLVGWACWEVDQDDEPDEAVDDADGGGACACSCVGLRSLES